MADRIDGLLFLAQREALTVMVCREADGIRLVIDCGGGLATFHPDRQSLQYLLPHLNRTAPPVNSDALPADPRLPIAG